MGPRCQAYLPKLGVLLLSNKNYSVLESSLGFTNLWKPPKSISEGFQGEALKPPTSPSFVARGVKGSGLRVVG